MPVLVSLSSGETFYVDGGFIDVLHAFEGHKPGHLAMVGSRAVNPQQVAQLQYVPEVPTIHTPEQLED